MNKEERQENICNVVYEINYITNRYRKKDGFYRSKNYLIKELTVLLEKRAESGLIDSYKIKAINEHETKLELEEYEFTFLFL